jgi:uncharacterized ParB-like nuclease family protein
MGALLVRNAKDQFRAYVINSAGVSAHFPLSRKRPVQNPAILNPEPTMQLEFHQLDQCWEHLRVRPAAQQRRLIASLAEGGQQTPIVVVESQGAKDRYVAIDGHKRIRALRQLGRDTVDATVWDMSAAEALLQDRTMRFSAQESALEQGWFLAEMEQRFHFVREGGGFCRKELLPERIPVTSRDFLPHSRSPFSN